eukprot:jgi/Tetstr1/454388/TSEL_041295.t1
MPNDSDADVEEPFRPRILQQLGTARKGGGAATKRRAEGGAAAPSPVVKRNALSTLNGFRGEPGPAGCSTRGPGWRDFGTPSVSQGHSAALRSPDRPSSSTSAAAEGDNLKSCSPQSDDEWRDYVIQEDSSQSQLDTPAGPRRPRLHAGIDTLRGLSRKGQIKYVHQKKAVAKRTGAVDGLSPLLEQVLRDCRQYPLYSHQADACQRVFKGSNVVVATPTASGKSLVFYIPVLEALLSSQGDARAIFLFPLKVGLTRSL